MVATEHEENQMKHTTAAYLDTRGTAEHTSLSISFLNQARLRGDGPPFLKVGRRVLYRVDDVDEWLTGQVRTSTSEEA
jgi:hypothetical protein